jgi:sec-independent protein translocase protein TatA
MPFELGLPEVLVVLVLALLFLGPKRLPEAGRSLGRGIREFREGIAGHDDPAGGDPPAAPAPPVE